MKTILLAAASLIGLLSQSACAQNTPHSEPAPATIQSMMKTQPAAAAQPGAAKQLATATFGAGCFWCTEAQFQQLEGVEKVESGYAGGQVENPTYKQVCGGNTGHAEVTNIYYDPAKVSYDELLAAFWTSHDPTQLNRQGNDVGTQYRSVIFYHNDEQRRLAEEYKKKLTDEKAYTGPVVTEIAPFTKFYKAEDYHQNYYNENGDAPYCQFVVRPKVDKFKKVFAGKLKK